MLLPLTLNEQLPLRTARLLIAPLELAHLDDLAAMLADPVVMACFPRPMTRPESEQWLRRSIERYRLHGSGLWAVLRERAGKTVFLGDCGVQVRTFGGRTHLELGYHFARHAWRQGFATEAAQACLALAFRHTDAEEIVALIRPENEASRRVARRLGMTPSGAVLHGGLVHDTWRAHRRPPGGLALQ